MILFVGFPSFAHDFEVGGIFYKHINRDAKTIKVTYKGSDCTSYQSEYSGDVKIPTTVLYNNEIYYVTEIDEYAFTYCDNMTSISIPNTINEIGDSTFFFCSGLKSISIPNSITKIGENAFNHCGSLNELKITDLAAWCKIDFHDRYSNPLIYTHKLILNGTEITSLDIPNEITEIKKYAFIGCQNLTNVNIHNSITKIGEYAFKSCYSLSKVNIPNSVISIGEFAFDYCINLTEVILPNSIFAINDQTFSDCNNLTSITIPNSVQKIGYRAFYNCKALTNVTIPNSVTTINPEAFYNCSSLTSIMIPNSVTHIGEFAFRYCKELHSVTLPNSISVINKGTFCNCTSLRSIIIPNSVTEIGEFAFYDCSSLYGLTIPSSVTKIRSSAFEANYVVSLNPTPPSLSGVPYDYYGKQLYVPKDSYAKYFTADVWGDKFNIYKLETFASSIELSNTEVTIDVGSTIELKSSIVPSDVSVYHLNCDNDNPKVVSFSGIITKSTEEVVAYITGISPGTAIITFRTIDGTNLSASCKVTINSVTPTITLSQSEATVPVNDIISINCTITNSNVKTATWSTSNENVAYVKPKNDGSATIVGMADGEATITATIVDNGVEYSASCKVIVGVGGIEVVEVDDNAVEVSRYDIHGRLLTEPTKGINIIKMSDGSTKKELIK